MIRKYLLPVVALAGFLFAVSTVVRAAKPQPFAEPVVDPAKADFGSFVAGAGIIEASTENIAVGTEVPGVVKEVLVVVGDAVKAGDPLFRLDDRDALAELAVRRTALAVEKERLARMMDLPRKEEVPAAEARVKAAEAAYADQKARLGMWESVQDRRAVSAEELTRQRYATESAAAELAAAKAEYDLLKAGAWKPDLDIQKAQVAAAEAQVAAAETDLDRLTVRAPVDGQVLQLKVRAGEYAPAGVLATPLALLGNVDTLHVRVDIDEHDAWRVRAEAPATASVRGNPDLKTTLEFVRFEPYIVPKRSLTGDSTERVDTRVLQVLYRFDRRALPLYVGQQMDVFVEAPPIAEPAAAASAES